MSEDISTVPAQAPPTQQQALVTALRALADTIEQHDLQIGSFASVGYGRVAIGGDDFERLFRGQMVRGNRQSGFVEVEAEYAGIVFTSNLYRPISPETHPVTISV